MFVASSMPIRDLESFAAASANGPRILSNRGANGIDGTVSSAFGVAATGAPAVLLIGDVALAHDIGGLLAASRLGLALTIVLLNNDGGGIFHFLPVAGEADAFEEHVLAELKRLRELSCHARPVRRDSSRRGAEASLGRSMIPTPGMCRK